ncbi:MAG: hypothetical protein H6812_00490 [Phycisphaeraceae bacterium]|nr:hypothetical protein [Phycisphaerales bacterium]MCB9841713.1 hypothetical protein [Phycisphaeraceae bacterium]
MVRRLIGVVVVAYWSSVASAGYIFNGYSYEIIEFPESPYAYVSTYDINSHGQFCGNYRSPMTGESQAFLWDPIDGLIDIPTPTMGSVAQALNDRGEVVGAYYTDFPPDGPVGAAYVWDASNGLHELDTPGMSLPAATSINNSGLVVGLNLYKPWGEGSFYYDTSTGFVVPPSVDDPYNPLSINNHGVAGGQFYDGTTRTQPARWTLGGEHELLALPDVAWRGWVMDIADDGTAVGRYNSIGSNAVGYAVWLPDGTVVDLGLIHPYGASFITISPDGTVLYTDADLHPFLWTPETGPVSLIDDLFYWTSGAINADGTIVLSSRDDNEVFYLTPIPTPATIALICCAIPFAMRRGR